MHVKAARKSRMRAAPAPVSIMKQVFVLQLFCSPTFLWRRQVRSPETVGKWCRTCDEQLFVCQEGMMKSLKAGCISATSCCVFCSAVFLPLSSQFSQLMPSQGCLHGSPFLVLSKACLHSETCHGTTELSSMSWCTGSKSFLCQSKSQVCGDWLDAESWWRLKHSPVLQLSVQHAMQKARSPNTQVLRTLQANNAMSFNNGKESLLSFDCVLRFLWAAKHASTASCCANQKLPPCSDFAVFLLIFFATLVEVNSLCSNSVLLIQRLFHLDKFTSQEWAIAHNQLLWWPAIKHFSLHDCANNTMLSKAFVFGCMLGSVFWSAKPKSFVFFSFSAVTSSVVCKKQQILPHVSNFEFLMFLHAAFMTCLEIGQPNSSHCSEVRCWLKDNLTVWQAPGQPKKQVSQDSASGRMRWSQSVCQWLQASRCAHLNPKLTLIAPWCSFKAQEKILFAHKPHPLRWRIFNCEWHISKTQQTAWHTSPRHWCITDPCLHHSKMNLVHSTQCWSSNFHSAKVKRWTWGKLPKHKSPQRPMVDIKNCLTNLLCVNTVLKRWKTLTGLSLTCLSFVLIQKRQRRARGNFWRLFWHGARKFMSYAQWDEACNFRPMVDLWWFFKQQLALNIKWECDSSWVCSCFSSSWGWWGPRPVDVVAVAQAGKCFLSQNVTMKNTCLKSTPTSKETTILCWCMCDCWRVFKKQVVCYKEILFHSQPATGGIGSTENCECNKKSECQNIIFEALCFSAPLTVSFTHRRQHKWSRKKFQTQKSFWS